MTGDDVPDSGTARTDWQLVRIDHVGVLVDDLDDGNSFLTGLLRQAISMPFERDDLKANFFGFAGDKARIEMIELKYPDEKREKLAGETARIEHIAIEVVNLDGLLGYLEANGVRATAPPRQARSYRTFWTVPETTGGVMYQFLERPGRAV